MDTDSLYLALAEKELEDSKRPEMRTEWQRLRSNDCVDSFTADAVANFLPRTCSVKHKQHDKREPGLFKEEFRCTEMLCLCSTTYCCYDVTSNKPKFSSKGLNKRVLEQSGDGTLEKHRRVLNEKVNVTSNNRGFRTNYHSVATYEQVKKRSVLLLPKTNSREWWNSYSTAYFVRNSLPFYFKMSCICPTLYTLINFLKQEYNLFT